GVGFALLEQLGQRGLHFGRVAVYRSVLRARRAAPAPGDRTAAPDPKPCGRRPRVHDGVHPLSVAFRPRSSHACTAKARTLSSSTVTPKPGPCGTGKWPSTSATLPSFRMASPRGFSPNQYSIMWRLGAAAAT